ncbi:hypothetical protein L195_g025991 [Trifolium pratense]|uniref:Uncharacterized protein n=1 Tax=Trifolium pratense TaxID=57577 RepID=A0A2K3NI35_TRIPR|nr:hypothetical protein L195_g025991 [Trifolium pratense]
MGGNNSRLINQSGSGDALPAKFRPLLRQRIEEFRNRRNARREESAMSKKELLKDDDRSSNARSSNANETLEETRLHKDEKTTTCVLVEKLSQVAPLLVYESRNGKEEEEEERKGHKDHVEKKIAAIKSALLEDENKHDDENEDEDENEDDIGRLIGPRSPSFRIYCIEAEERKEKELCDTDTHVVSEYPDEKENQDNDVHRKSLSTNSDESVTSESENSDYSNEVVKTETTPKKKGHHKRKKLEAIKKNLLNVKNIQKNRMNRMMTCTGGNNDRNSLIM